MENKCSVSLMDIRSKGVFLGDKSTREIWLNKPMLVNQLRPWLIDKGSLTARLQKQYLNFSVKPVTLKYSKPIQDEAKLLLQPSYKTALVREVLLLGDDHAVVFAHSVLPRSSLRGEWNGLGRLGSKPLGATLFANTKVKRTPLSYKKLSPNHTLYKLVAQHLNLPPGCLWARRSIFNLNCANIMVTEVFLPQLLVR
jgi:chorismate--pyruvate lyase